jgi:ABC-type Na+ transport system ATPase subunit NatA
MQAYNTCIEIHGKVASLLEVGTGFHPELSGRENVYLNGAILGMPMAEIRKKFDAIVDFSGVEKFIDTPVKHYSSGMYVRLAFAVSAWLDPDILIIDEVLAVGDQAFQRKCGDRMKELTREGRTVLFVSHSMASVNKLCQKAVFLEQGRLVSFGPVEEATGEYQRHINDAAGTSTIPPHMRTLQNPTDRHGSGEIRISTLDIAGAAPGRLAKVTPGGELVLNVSFKPPDAVAQPPSAIDVAVGIDDEYGARIGTVISSWYGTEYNFEGGTGHARIAIDQLWLRPGTYLLSLALIDAGSTLDVVVNCGAFEVSLATTAEPAFGSGGLRWQPDHGSLRFPTTFT